MNDHTCLKCEARGLILTNEFDKFATMQCIKGFRCNECNEMNYICRLCFERWWTNTPSQFRTEPHYQIFCQDIHFMSHHPPLDVV